MYETSARHLLGIANAGAVDCHAIENELLCQQMGIEAFPTLKIISPDIKSRKSKVEDYKGERRVGSIVNAVYKGIPNHLAPVEDEQVDDWLFDRQSDTRAIYFSPTPRVEVAVRVAATELIGNISIAQITGRRGTSMDHYRVASLPALLLFHPGEGAQPIPYTGKWSKIPVVKFLTQDPEPILALPPGNKPDAFLLDEPSRSATTRVDSTGQPTGQPQVPAGNPPHLPIPAIASFAELRALCLNHDSGICILILFPPGYEIVPHAGVLSTFSDLKTRQTKRNEKVLPIYHLAGDTAITHHLRLLLRIVPRPQPDIVALNAKRNWFSRYRSRSYDLAEVENFVSELKTGSALREWMPEDLFQDDGEEMISSSTATEHVNMHPRDEVAGNEPDSEESFLDLPDEAQQMVVMPFPEDMMQFPENTMPFPEDMILVHIQSFRIKKPIPAEEDKAAPKNHNLKRSSERGQRPASKTQGEAVGGRAGGARAEEIPEVERIRPLEVSAVQQCALMSDPLLGTNSFQSDLNNMRCIKRRDYHTPYGVR